MYYLPRLEKPYFIRDQHEEQRCSILKINCVKKQKTVFWGRKLNLSIIKELIKT